MGQRGELFSTRVLLHNRTYFFNVKENRMGDLYLNIVESKNRDEGGFDRQSVILFADDLQEFLKGFDEALRILEKEVREKRHTPRPRAHSGAASDSSASVDSESAPGKKSTRGSKPRKDHAASERAAPRGKRVVVKKK